MFRIKVCGITRPDDAQLCEELGADAIGLNFYRASPRGIDVATAKKICTSLSSHVAKAGVFVNQTVAEIRQIANDLQLDFVQLHGGQSLQFARQIEYPLIRAIAWSDLDTTSAECVTWAEAGAKAVLLDSRRGKKFGGTGRPLDWPAVAQLEMPLPLILAGGLNGDNVLEAIRATRPAAVDSASGTEMVPGKKDRERVTEFVENAKTGFAEINSVNAG